MKALIPMLIMTVTATVVGQTTHDKMIQAVAGAVNAKYKVSEAPVPGVYRPNDWTVKDTDVLIESDTVSAGIVTGTPLHTFIIHVPYTVKDVLRSLPKDTKNKQAAALEASKAYPQGMADAMLARVVAALQQFDEKYAVTVRAELLSKTTFVSKESGNYYSTPLHITTWCSGIVCSSTVTGGEVRQRYSSYSIPYKRTMATAVYQNY